MKMRRHKNRQAILSFYGSRFRLMRRQREAVQNIERAVRPLIAALKRLSAALSMPLTPMDARINSEGWNG